MSEREKLIAIARKLCPHCTGRYAGQELDRHYNHKYFYEGEEVSVACWAYQFNTEQFMNAILAADYRPAAAVRTETVEACAAECDKPEPECCGRPNVRYPVTESGEPCGPPTEECCGSPEPRYRNAGEIREAIRALAPKGESDDR